MAPASRILPRNVAEPPQESAPYGRWADRLRSEFLAAAQGFDHAGVPGEVVFYPDRTWHGRTYVPASAPTELGMQLFGYVMYVPDTDGGEPTDFTASADCTEETAERNPEWQLDLCEEVIGSWRGEGGKVAAMTLVWGSALRSGGAVVTAELGNLAVDQCTLAQERFTLIAPDDYGGDLMVVRLWSSGGDQVAEESLYDE